MPEIIPDRHSQYPTQAGQYYPMQAGQYYQGMPPPPGPMGMLGNLPVGDAARVAGMGLGGIGAILGILTALIILIVALAELGKDTSNTSGWILLGVGGLIGGGSIFLAKKAFSRQNRESAFKLAQTGLQMGAML